MKPQNKKNDSKNLPSFTVCLLRVSSDKQEKNGNIESQKQECMNYAKQRNLEINDFIIEDGISGWKDGGKRPGLEQLQKFIKENHNKYRINVIFRDISRLARRVEISKTFLNLAKKMNVEVFFVNTKYENTSTGKFMQVIDAGLAEMQSDQKHELTISSMSALARDGFYVFNLPPGYTRNKNESDKIKRKYVLRDEPNASLIYQAFRDYLRGKLATKHAVAEFLTESKDWTGGKVNDEKANYILTNRVYTGTFSYEKWDIPRQKWKMDVIVPEKLFNDVQKKMEQNLGILRKCSHDSDNYPLTRHVVCEKCGKPLKAYSVKNGRFSYYQCYNKNCDLCNKTIPQKHVEDAFEKRLDMLSADDDDISLFNYIMEQVAKEKDRDIYSDEKNTAQELESVNANIATYAQMIGQAYRNKDDTAVKLYTDLLKDFKKQKEDLENKKAKNKLFDSKEFLTALEKGTEFLKNPGLLWKKGTPEQKRRLAKMIFPDRIAYSKETGFLTASTPHVFNEKPVSKDGNSELAAPLGFEPGFSP